jgi:hypothetical protein
MKKIAVILMFLGFALAVNAQSMWKPVPKTLFTELKGTVQAAPVSSVWLWRFNATLVADELVWDKTTKQFDSSPLSGVGPGIGIRHYYLAPDGTPASDWGVSFVALLGTDINNLSPADFKPVITVNAFNFLNVGVDYGVKAKTFGILFGAQVSF